MAAEVRTQSCPLRVHDTACGHSGASVVKISQQLTWYSEQLESSQNNGRRLQREADRLARENLALSEKLAAATAAVVAAAATGGGGTGRSGLGGIGSAELAARSLTTSQRTSRSENMIRSILTGPIRKY